MNAEGIWQYARQVVLAKDVLSLTAWDMVSRPPRIFELSADDVEKLHQNELSGFLDLVEQDLKPLIDDALNLAAEDLHEATRLLLNIIANEGTDSKGDTTMFDDHRKMSVRDAAWGLLAYKLGEKVVDDVILALKSEEAVIRFYAAYVLNAVRSRRSIKPLIATLRDTDEKVRFMAVGALGEIQDSRAIEPLIKLERADSSSRIREACTEILSKLKRAQAERKAQEEAQQRERWRAEGRCEKCGTLLRPLNFIDKMLRQKHCPEHR